MQRAAFDMANAKVAGAGAVLFLLCVAPARSGHCGDAPQSLESHWSTAIRNDQLRWDGSFVGLWPHLDEQAAKLLPHIKDDEIPLLLEALKEEERFAIAHVLLTKRFAESYRVSAATWNGMEVNLYGDGSAEYPPGTARRVLEYWQGWYAKRQMAK